MFHRAFNFPITGTNPVPHNKRSVQIHKQATKKVGQHIFSRKTHRNTTHTTKGQYTGNTVAKGLQNNQHTGNNNRHPKQLADGFNRVFIKIFFTGFILLLHHDFFGATNQPQQKHHNDNDHTHITNRVNGRKNGRATFLLNNFRRKA